ncbi:unnamed protein product, partial [Meganyctiphanes norvegica]
QLMWPWLLTFQWDKVTSRHLLILVPAFIFSNIALTRITAILRRQRKKENRSVIGDALACSYYGGYLEELFTEKDEQSFSDRIILFEAEHGCTIQSHKLYIISFASCTNNFTAYKDLEKIGEPLQKVSERGGVRRTFNNQV